MKQLVCVFALALAACGSQGMESDDESGFASIDQADLDRDAAQALKNIAEFTAAKEAGENRKFCKELVEGWVQGRGTYMQVACRTQNPFPVNARTGDQVMAHERGIEACVRARHEAMEAYFTTYADLKDLWEQTKQGEDAAKWDAHYRAIAARSAEVATQPTEKPTSQKLCMHQGKSAMALFADLRIDAINQRDPKALRGNTSRYSSADFAAAREKLAGVYDELISRFEPRFREYQSLLATDPMCQTLANLEALSRYELEKVRHINIEDFLPSR